MSVYLQSDLTGSIINAFYCVYNELGFGFLEKVYENALAFELRQRGYQVVQQAPIPVWYHDVKVGEYYADLLVNDCVILELKAAEGLIVEHEAQLLNYLRATRVQVGLLLNFGPKPQIRRKVFETARHPANLTQQ
jgi:GxxExxY protein